MEPEIEYAVVRINYKSGISEYMKVTDFKWSKKNGVMEVNWTLHETAVARPLFLNLDEIESIWQAEVVLKEAQF